MDEAFRQTAVPVDVELKPEGASSGFCDSFQRRCRKRARDHERPHGGGGACAGPFALRMSEAVKCCRRKHYRHRDRRTEHCCFKLWLANAGQRSRSQEVAIECASISAQSLL